MVRMYGAQMSDVSDRATRAIGVPSINQCGAPNDNRALQSNVNLGLLTYSQPWWLHHHQGRTLFLDDMTGTRKYVQQTGTLTLASDAGCVLQGANALKMVSPAVATQSAWGSLKIPPGYPDLSYLVIELYWAVSNADISTLSDWVVQLIMNDKGFGAQYTASVRYYNYDSGVQKTLLQTKDSTGTWRTTIPPSTHLIEQTTPMYNHWLIGLVRGTDWKFKWFSHNGQAIVLADYTMPTAAFGGDEWQLNLINGTDKAAASTVYVGGLMITDDLATSWYNWA